MQSIRLLKTISVVAMLGWFFMPCNAAPQIDRGTLLDVAIPYYAPGQSSPSAVVRIQRLYTDYQRRGFFRIGLLPTLVAEDVKVEVLEPDRVLEALQGAQQWLKPKAAGKTLEWRRVQFIFPHEKEPRLEAARVNPIENGAWRLTENVVFRSGTNETRNTAAALQVTGRAAGELLLQGGGSGRVNLLDLSTDNTFKR